MSQQSEPTVTTNIETKKRVVFTKGGKGSVGKTGFMVNLAEWFLENEIPFTLPWISTLSPDDEVAHLAYAMGYLGLLIREGPSLVAAERTKLADFQQISKDTSVAASATRAASRIRVLTSV